MAFERRRLGDAFVGTLPGSFRAWTYVATEALEAVTAPGWLPWGHLQPGDLVWLAIDPPAGPRPLPERQRALTVVERVPVEEGGRNALRLRVVLDLGVVG